MKDQNKKTYPKVTREDFEKLSATTNKDEAFQIAQQIFNTIDVDGNGFVDREEMEHLIAQIFNDKHQETVKVFTQHTMSVMDHDGDGKISVQEFALGFVKSKLFNAGQRRSTIMAAQLSPEPEDYFLISIKKKGFCNGLNANKLRVKKTIPEMTSSQIEEKLQPHLFNYSRSVSDQQQPFAIYLIQKLLQSQSELGYIQQQLVDIWNCLDKKKDREIQVTVYHNFLNDIFTADHISFFIQTQSIISRVVHGDGSNNASLATVYVEVERVVDIVNNIFKTSAAMSLFEGTTMLEVSFSQLQNIIQSLLSNIKIVYQQGTGHVNAQELQIQSLLEFEKLKVKLQYQKRRPSGTIKKLGLKAIDTISTATGAQTPKMSKVSQKESLLEKNKTFLPVSAIMYQKETLPKDDDAMKKKKRNAAELQLLNLPGVKGFGSSGKRVAAIMTEKFSKTKQITKFMDQDSGAESAHGHSTERGIKQKIDALLNNKKKEPKIYNNNPTTKLNYTQSEAFIQPFKFGTPQKITRSSKSKDKDSLAQTQQFSTKGISQHESQTKATTNYNAAAQQQQFQVYQIKKMYNADETGNFGTAEIKLKQLQLQLREAEHKNAQLTQENNALKKSIKEINSQVPPQIADRIEFCLVLTSKAILSSFDDHKKLCKKHGESQIKLLEEEEMSKLNVLKIFKEIGRERAFNNIGETRKSMKKLENGIKLAIDDKIVKGRKALHEESSDSHEVEEPKDTIASLLLGFKRTPLKTEIQKVNPASVAAFISDNRVATNEAQSSQTQSIVDKLRLRTDSPRVKVKETNEESVSQQMTTKASEADLKGQLQIDDGLANRQVQQDENSQSAQSLEV